MINTKRWLKIIDERIEMQKRLKLYHVDLPLTSFELLELKEIILAAEQCQNTLIDDGK